MAVLGDTHVLEKDTTRVYAVLLSAEDMDQILQACDTAGIQYSGIEALVAKIKRARANAK